MSDERGAGCVAVVFVLLMFSTLVSIVGWSRCSADWRKECVARGVAHYDSGSGKWQWNDDKPEKQQ